MAEVSTVCCEIRCITLFFSRLINKIAGRYFEHEYPDSVMLDEIMEFHELGPADVEKLYKIFVKADTDDSGAIELEEFFEFLGCERDVYGDYLFQLIDVNGDGGLDFEEFVLAVCTYCGFAHEDILKFVFYIFDPDKSGYLEYDELRWFCKILHQKNPDMRNLTDVDRVIELFDVNKDGRIDFAEFTEMDKQFPKVTFPAYQMQVMFAQATLGISFFEDRKWYKEQVQIKAEKAEAARRRAQERERQKAKRDQKRRLIMRKMGCCRYYLCCCMREAYYQIAIGDRDGRPDFENPVIKEMTTRESRFKTTNNDNDEIFEQQANAAWEQEVLRARQEREKIAKKKEEDRKARQQRRSKRNRTRHTTSHKRGYPSLSSKAEKKSKFELEYTKLKSMNNTRVAPEEAW